MCGHGTCRPGTCKRGESRHCGCTSSAKTKCFTSPKFAQQHTNFVVGVKHKNKYSSLSHGYCCCCCCCGSYGRWGGGSECIFSEFSLCSKQSCLIEGSRTSQKIQCFSCTDSLHTYKQINVLAQTLGESMEANSCSISGTFRSLLYIQYFKGPRTATVAQFGYCRERPLKRASASSAVDATSSRDSGFNSTFRIMVMDGADCGAAVPYLGSPKLQKPLDSMI